MTHKVFFDEQKDVVRMFLIGDVTVEDAASIASALGAIPAEKRKHILIDVSETRTSALMRKDVRTAMSEKFKPLGRNKTAIVGASPAIRMLVKALTAMIGTSDLNQYFASEEEALVWLKEE
jgi:hypothetical protein